MNDMLEDVCSRAWRRAGRRAGYGLLLACVCASTMSMAQETTSARPGAARLYLISPQDGERLKGPVVVRFGLTGMGVAPAGIDMKDTGHHHLLVDLETLPDMRQPLPTTKHVLHYGRGQTETVLELTPGTHTLQLLLGDHLHRPHRQPLLSERITIEVIE